MFKILSDYGVENAATYIPDKKKTFQKSKRYSLLISEAVFLG